MIASEKSAIRDTKVNNEIQALIGAARTAIVEARSAGAEKYAKEFLESAESKLIVAEEALKKDENEVALNFAKKAKEEAMTAKNKALAGAMLEKAGAAIKAAAAAGAENSAPELYNRAEKYLLAGQKKNIEKDYTGAYEAAKIAYESGSEALRLSELVKKNKDLLEQAKADIAEAEKAGAGKAAPELLASAKENMNKALAAFSEKDYVSSIDSAGKASDDAKAAKSACLAAASVKAAALATKYTVIKGDNLWNISKSPLVFSDPFLWPLLYKNNRDKIKDPDLIYPEQQFELPVKPVELQK